MSNFKLAGPHDLSENEIDARGITGRLGVYILGSIAQSGDFQSWKVGHSDDLGLTLKENIGEYLYFKYSFCEDETEVFPCECELYHEINPEDNPTHPDTSGQEQDCPVWGV